MRVVFGYRSESRYMLNVVFFSTASGQLHEGVVYRSGTTQGETSRIVFSPRDFSSVFRRFGMNYFAWT